MENQSEQLPPKHTFEEPIIITEPEPWVWNVLAKAFLNDLTLNFWLGEKTNEESLKDFFEAVIRDVLKSGGTVFSSPNRQVVFIWSWIGRDATDSNEHKARWYEVLEPEGVKRYYWSYEAGDLALDPEKINKSMEPAYLGVHPDLQGKGYGSHIFKWTLNYFEKQGYDVPYILASSRRAAKLYCPLLGFFIHKEVFAAESDSEPIGVFLKRIRE